MVDFVNTKIDAEIGQDLLGRLFKPNAAAIDDQEATATGMD